MSSTELSAAIQEGLDSNPFLEELVDPATIPSAEERAEFDRLPPTRSQTVSDDYDPFLTLQSERGLREILREQVWSQCADDRLRLTALLIIDSLDDDGYLREDLDQLAPARELGLGADELQSGLLLVQTFEPCGVAARDLSECLCLQLRALKQERSLAYRIVRQCLDLLALRDYPALASRFETTVQAAHEAHRLIRSLNPRPGLSFAPVRDSYIEPDVIVTGQGAAIRATINPLVMPRISVNRHYVGLVRSELRDHAGLRQQLQEARWMLRHSAQRFETLQRVSNAIVWRQRAFFTDGAAALKPLMLKQIADDVGLHMSTISRATANKTMATPRGLFEFRYFFPRELRTKAGAPSSSAAVRNAIREMIAAEPPGGAESDVSLTRRLEHRGIRISRRTVTKYRNAMRILPAELRASVPA